MAFFTWPRLCPGRALRLVSSPRPILQAAALQHSASPGGVACLCAPAEAASIVFERRFISLCVHLQLLSAYTLIYIAHTRRNPRRGFFMSAERTRTSGSPAPQWAILLGASFYRGIGSSNSGANFIASVFCRTLAVRGAFRRRYREHARRTRTYSTRISGYYARGEEAEARSTGKRGRACGRDEAGEEDEGAEECRGRRAGSGKCSLRCVIHGLYTADKV